MMVPSRSRKTARVIDQTPNTREQTPNTKHQTPKKLQTTNPKLQRNRKFQAPMIFCHRVSPPGSTVLRLRLGAWIFFGVWSLVFGVSPKGVCCFTERCLVFH